MKQGSKTAAKRARKAPVAAKARTVLKVGSNFYVLASSLTSRRETRVLADAQSFAVFEAGGDIAQSPLEALGFFFKDTRFLSGFEMSIAGQAPYFLNSYLSDDNAEFRVNLTNPDLTGPDGKIELPRNSIQIERSWAIVNAALYHRLVVSNYAHAPATLPFDLVFGVDFADLFEVRGVTRGRRGQDLPVQTGENKIRFRYRGLDKVTRFTEITFDPLPKALTDRRASFALELADDECVKLEVRVRCGVEEVNGRPVVEHPPGDFHGALAARHGEIASARAGWADITASHGILDYLLKRSAADLTSIVAHTDRGSFMMAGIPWFATLFGRDSIVTALSVLQFNPDIAGRTLKMLAGLQGTKVDDARDEQPGKIVHEMRAGEMAATGEIPFGRYYGTVDATPLFLWLVGLYVSITGDLKLAADLWPNVERALEWIDQWGDRDHDGYVEYMQETPQGLANQGWKDSFDSISHANGELAAAPIALCEVQGYLYAAYTEIGNIAARMEHVAMAGKLAQQAADLKSKFVRDFWIEEMQTVALALDGDKQACKVMSSNAGHCLATGIVDGAHGEKLSERLLRNDICTGWGIRTLSDSERRYNPMSYHNGSIWPHDNAIAALGLARCGNRSGVIRILEGLLDAAVSLRSGSLPELFCGFHREPQLGPVPYPVACHPQAWSAASVFLILQAILGMRIQGFENSVTVETPVLPSWLEWIKVENLKVGQGTVSLSFRRMPTGAAAVEVLARQGNVEVNIHK
ncbi:MAG: amylo-alpha-1,6-glucosidase [Deltaproteobacteria bacterium]|nr:amylo-alpha-1,6-glucosidase [Deltaproteobacteria bacterium]